MADHTTVFEAMIKAIEANDAEAVRNGFHEDAVIWHNTTQIEQGRDDIVAVVQALHANFTDVVYDIRQVLATTEGAVGQIVLRATAADGERIAMHAAMLMAIDGSGRVTRADEYLDSAESVRRKADM
jgi:uncharacterized protein (TIGR02246 family)